MDTKVKNPKTGRWIKVGGPVYNKLIEQGVRLNQQQKKQSKKYQPPLQQQTQLPSHFKDYPVDRQQTAWGNKKPQSVGQRRMIKDECGSSCFLYSTTTKTGKDKLKFPVCNKKLPCTYNCRGIRAAAARAGEWKYEKVLETAKTLRKKLNC